MRHGNPEIERVLSGSRKPESNEGDIQEMSSMRNSQTLSRPRSIRLSAWIVQFSSIGNRAAYKLVSLVGLSSGCVLSSFALPTNSDAVVLQGTCEYAVYQGRTNALYISTHNWQASISDCCWEISYVDVEALANSNKLSLGVVASCDANDIYVAYCQNESAVRAAWGDRYPAVKKTLPVATASIYPGAYPPPTEAVLQRIWLPYASRCLLTHDQGLAKPPFIVDLAIFRNTNYFCSYAWVGGPGQEGNAAPRKLVFRSDGNCFDRDTVTGEPIKFSLAPPFDKGYLMAEGNWLRTTNIAGHSLPTEFEFKAFVPESTRTARDLVLSFKYRCVVTNLYLSVMPALSAALPLAAC
jgi:hypothetical protein